MKFIVEKRTQYDGKFKYYLWTTTGTMKHTILESYYSYNYKRKLFGKQNTMEEEVQIKFSKAINTTYQVKIKDILLEFDVDTIVKPEDIKLPE